MDPIPRFDVFQLLVGQSCRRAAPALWVDLFDDLLRTEVFAVPGAPESDPQGAAKAAAASTAGIELQHMFNWLTAVTFHRTSVTTEVLPPGALDVAMEVRKRITQGCVKLIDERSAHGEWPAVYNHLLMKLWEDSYGNLLSRSIQEVRAQSAGK